MSDCIFCKIVAGEIPCFKLYEDDQVLAFLDVGPLSEGHCLVIPKLHLERLDDAGPEHAATLAAVMGVVTKVGTAVMKALNSAGGDFRGWNLLQNNGEVSGQVVPHVHFHIIPRTAGDGLGYRWNAGKLDMAKGPGLAAAIVEAMG